MRLIRKHIPFVLEKAEDGADPLSDRIIEGYASTFESPERHDSHGDIILPGAFKQAIDEHDAGGYQVKLFLRHQTGIGVMLKMVEDAKGLFIRARISETREGDDALTLVRDGVLDSFSIAFVIESEDDFQDLAVMTKWGYPVRAFKRIPLKENSLLEIPSNEFARVTQVRSDRLTHYKARVAHQLEVEQEQEQKTLDEEREERSAEAQLAGRGRGRKCVKLGVAVTELVASHVEADYTEADVLKILTMCWNVELEAIKEIMSGEAVEPRRSTLEAIADALDADVEVLVLSVEEDGAALDEELEAEVEAVEVEVEVEDAPLEEAQLEAEAVSEDDSTEETNTNTNASAEIEAAVAAFQDIISLISCST